MKIHWKPGTHSASRFSPGKVRACPPAVDTEPAPSACHFRNSDVTDGRYPLPPSSLGPLGREQGVLLVPGKVRLGAGGRATSFPDETGLPGHQPPCSEGCSDKGPYLNSGNVAVCNMECLRHLLEVSHYKWMEGIQEYFIRWELLSEHHIFQGRILIRHYLYL